jgi:hypothetical protein
LKKPIIAIIIGT